MALILLASPATLAAQGIIDSVDAANAPQPPSDAIGPPQLREFELPGTRVVPARPSLTPPLTVTPPVATPVPVNVAPIRPREAPAQQIAPRQAQPVAPPNPTPGTSPVVAQGEPPVASPDPTAMQPSQMPPAEASPAPAPLPTLEEPTDAGFTFSWAYALGLAIAAGLLGMLLFQRRRRKEGRIAYQLVGGDQTADAPELPPVTALRRQFEMKTPAAPPPPLPRAPQAKAPETEDPPAYLVRPAAPAAPARAPAAAQPGAPAADGVVGIQIRPWLQLQFKPERATATDSDAAVQFELVIANTGNAVATNIRIDARMFNAGLQLEQEIEAWFAAPIPHVPGNVLPAIQPRSAASMRSTVTLPKQHVREFEVQGRRLFIPTVAINVCYEWGSGKRGRTSMSFLVGREPENASSKMSPLRLDQGPRIYRQLGQRPSQPAVLV